MRQTNAVAVTIHELLDGLRATSLDERDKGDKSDRLINYVIGPSTAQHVRHDRSTAITTKDPIRL